MDLVGTDLNGQPSKVSFAKLGKPSLALVYSPSCGYCAKNLPQWQRLAADERAVNLVLIDVSGQMTQSDLEHLGLPAHATVIRLSSQSRLENNLLLTPATISVANDGIVRYTALGVLDSGTIFALHRSFNPS
jgi:thiol-disulfide isomerase/thioredoxin